MQSRPALGQGCMKRSRRGDFIQEIRSLPSYAAHCKAIPRALVTTWFSTVLSEGEAPIKIRACLHKREG